MVYRRRRRTYGRRRVAFKRRTVRRKRTAVRRKYRRLRRITHKRIKGGYPRLQTNRFNTKRILGDRALVKLRCAQGGLLNGAAGGLPYVYSTILFANISNGTMGTLWSGGSSNEEPCPGYWDYARTFNNYKVHGFKLKFEFFPAVSGQPVKMFINFRKVMPSRPFELPKITTIEEQRFVKTKYAAQTNVGGRLNTLS